MYAREEGLEGVNLDPNQMYAFFPTKNVDIKYSFFLLGPYVPGGYCHHFDRLSVYPSVRLYGFPRD